MRLPIRLLAIDIDGTLLNSHFTISPVDLESLRQAHAMGVEVILCTGRRLTFALPIAQQLGFDHWLCSSNGAITRSLTGEHFHADLLPAGIARQFCGYMADYRGGTVLTFDKDTKGALVVERTNDLVEIIRRWVDKNMSYIECVAPIEDALTTDPVQAMICGTVAQMQEAEARLHKWVMLGEVTLVKTQYDERDLCLLDILNKDCSKGHAVRRWALECGIPKEAVMAIGDNYNDVEMLEFAGRPVIMGNAPTQLKSRGWLETLSNDENGIAVALEKALGKSVSGF